MSDRKLSQYATDEKYPSYLSAYRDYKRGKIEGGYQDSRGNIFVKSKTGSVMNPPPTNAVQNSNASIPTLNYENISLAHGDDGGITTTRKNRAAVTSIGDRFANIDNGISPIITQDSNFNVSDAVVLCQKAYFNVALVRNTIDLMTEFSTGNIYFKGGNKNSRNFFEALFKKINLPSFLDIFFRDYFRSGSCFVWEFQHKIQKDDLTKMTQVYGLDKSIASKNIVLPAKFIMLNPADITVSASANFINPVYYKILNGYEIARLKKPQTEQDKEIMESLPKKVQEAILQGNPQAVIVPLSTLTCTGVFYKKQDYEALAIPMIWPVLDDINWKIEMRKMDMATTRMLNQAILLVTTGAEPEKGGINQNNITNLQRIFQNESVGRVLIADYTTKASFIIPDIAAILDPKKYEALNNDIYMGLNYILAGDEKFANTSIKIQLFIERLKHGRRDFINNFLYPVMRRISKDMGFKNYPEPFFEEINLKDEVEWARIYTRLAELGFLTPQETFKAIENSKVPLADESMENQLEFSKLKNQGLYQSPLAQNNDIFNQEGGAGNGNGQPAKKSNIPQPTGRPSGTTRKQSTKKIGPIGGSKMFSGAAVIKNVLSVQKIEHLIIAALLKKFKLKSLNDKQIILANDIKELIVINEPVENWEKSVDQYIKNPVDTNIERAREVESIAVEHGIEPLLAGILFNSAKE